MVDEAEFDTLDVLGTATGRLLREGGMSAIHEICEFVAGEPVWTHQLPRVMREFSEHFKKTYPDFAAVFDEVQDMTSENYAEIAASWLARYGAKIRVTRMTHDEHERIDPMSELAEKVHPKNIIVV